MNLIRKSMVIMLLLALGTFLGVACSENILSESTPTPLPTPVPFKDTSFKVPAGNEYQLSLSMTAGSTFEYRFQSDLDINVRIIDPFGDSMVSWERVLENSGTTMANVTGVHQVVFDNSFSLFTSKTVQLSYRMVPPGGR